MPKVRLVLEDLSIESFDTTPAAGASRSGTVYGRAEQSGTPDCPMSPKCEYTPLASCEQRCQADGEQAPWGAR